MTREEKIAKAQKLRAEGMSYEAIGKALGVTGSCVQGWLKPEWAKERARRSNAKPERKAAKRAHENAARALCACGNPMGQGTGYPGHEASRCQKCRIRADHAAVDERAQQIVAWWAEGETLKQIAARLGWSVNYVGTEFARLRAEGYSLTYRQTPKKNAPRHPAQVAA